MEYPQGANMLPGACKPTPFLEGAKWDPKPGREAPSLHSGFSKALVTAQVEVFFCAGKGGISPILTSPFGGASVRLTGTKPLTRRTLAAPARGREDGRARGSGGPKKSLRKKVVIVGCCTATSWDHPSE